MTLAMRTEALKRSLSSVARHARRLLKDQRGAVLVEYAFLLTAVGIPVAMGIVAGGVAMLREYVSVRDTVMAPFP
jgi:Flp pilus assembly pilin Flp